MEEERYTPEEAIQEAERVKKMVGPAGETKDYERAEEVVEKEPEGLRAKLMARFSPDRLDQKIYQELKQKEMAEEEAKRREELGPKGRIREDVEKSIQDVFLTRAEYKAAYQDYGEQGGKIYGVPAEKSAYTTESRAPMEVGPFSKYADSALSGCEKIDKFVKENGLSDDNYLTRELRGPLAPVTMFCFGTGLNEHNQMPYDDEENLRACIVGLGKDYRTEVAIELTEEYLDSLSKDDLTVLEKAAREAAVLAEVIRQNEARAYRHRTENLP
jgi:hypothetical protein